MVLRKRLTSVITAMVMLLGFITFMPMETSAKVVSNGTMIQITKENQLVDSINFYGTTVEARYTPMKGRTESQVWGDAEYSCYAFMQKFYYSVYGFYVGGDQNSVYVSGGKGAFVKTSTPVVGDICAMPNHWAIVKKVNGDGTYTLIEQNWAWTSSSTGVSNRTDSSGRYYDPTYCNVGRIVSGPDSQHWFWHYTLSKSNTNAPTNVSVKVGSSKINYGAKQTFTFSAGNNANYYYMLVWNSRGDLVTGYLGQDKSCTLNIYSCGTMKCTVIASNYTGYKESSTVTFTVGHDFQTDSYDPYPTCTQAGVEIQKCTSCGETRKVIAYPTGHNWVTLHEDATDVSFGRDYNYCTKCGAEETIEEYPPACPSVTVVGSDELDVSDVYLNIVDSNNRLAYINNVIIEDNKLTYVLDEPGKYDVYVKCSGYVPMKYSSLSFQDYRNIELSPELCRPGDVDGDGKLSAGDVTAMSAHVKGIKLLSSYARDVADLDGDGNVGASDLTIASAHVKGLKLLW